MEELYLRNKRLITEDEWDGIIDESITSFRAGISDVKKALISAVKRRLPGKKFGIFFSGGIDSVLIAKLCREMKQDFTCYTAGFYDKEQKYPEDLEWAEKTAKELDVKLVKIVLNLKEAERIIKKTVEILGKELDNVVNAGVGSVFVAVLEKAKEKHFFSGLGSEEIFAGYERHEKAEDINKECIAGLKSMYARDLLRDFAISRHYRASFLTPFLDPELVKLSMGIPAELKLSKEYKKIILRQAAEELGIPKNIAWRKKRAAQYGSRMDKAILKLAKQAGFRMKKDYLDQVQQTL